MRKVTLFIASSLDDFVARADGGIDWLFTDQDYGYRDFYDSIDTVLMGSKTFKAAEQLGEQFAGKECFVFSRSSEPGSGRENIHFVSDPVGFTKSLVKQVGKLGIFLEGGGEIVSLFLNEGLIDEIILSVHPVLLGEGIPLFRNVSKQVNLKLLGTRSYDSGLVQLHYQVVKDASE